MKYFKRKILYKLILQLRMDTSDHRDSLNANFLLRFEDYKIYFIFLIFTLRYVVNNEELKEYSFYPKQLYSSFN